MNEELCKHSKKLKKRTNCGWVDRYKERKKKDSKRERERCKKQRRFSGGSTFNIIFIFDEESETKWQNDKEKGRMLKAPPLISSDLHLSVNTELV